MEVDNGNDPFDSLDDYDDQAMGSNAGWEDQPTASNAFQYEQPTTSNAFQHHQPMETDLVQEDHSMSDSTSDMEQEIILDESDEPLSPFVPPTEREDAPLGGVLASEYDNIDPRKYFFDYKRTGILRFSKMFGVNPKALSQNMIWWPSKTFCNKPEQRKQAVNPEKSNELQLNIGPDVTKDKCVYDQTEFLLKSEAELEALKSLHNEEDDEPPAWRFGPAQLWYDRLGLPEKPHKFDYGFKTNRFNIITTTSKKPITSHTLSNDELLPVNLLHWEDDIIMDGSEIDTQKILNGREPKCGWISTQHTRNYQAYKATFSSDNNVNGPDPTHSIFPADNYELENTRWEEDIIFDAENMSMIPKPRVLTIEYDDEPAIFGVPEDVSYEEKSRDDRNVDRKDHAFTKKSKMILNQVQRRQKQEEDEHLESHTQNTDKDVFNMSNDEYYAPKNTHRAIGSGAAIQHSIPAQNIHHAFFPTHLDNYSLRHLNRLPPSKRIMRHLIDRDLQIHNALNFIAEAEDRRKHQTLMDSGTEIFHMRNLKDLSARDGTLICIEYSEEHPPLLSQPGMASKIRNYYRRKTQKENDVQFECGETAFTMNLPFLGNLNLGQSLQAIENNMYRAPIYKHKPPITDFILIRCADGLFLRECPNIFVAGQECPLMEVPSPNSKKANVFGRDSLLAFIYRLFWQSENQPRRLRMEDVRESFPDYAESSIRKRLKQCSDFTRSASGPDQNYWAIKDDFRLPSKEEVLAMLTPEMCCAHYSMQSAEQRLRDAGYGEKYFLTPENDDDSDDQVTIEDEIKCAPWNTTRSYISASKGKCLLDQTGIGDPTGCGQGFSYVRVTQKPQKEDLPQMPKRLVTGTNADLRKLPLKEAKDICRSYGIKEEEINSLTRWEIIDVIRTLSTQKAKSNADFSGMGRFARGNIRFNSADTQDKYKQYCQHVFDLQNEVLASVENLSTDEGSDNEDTDNEDMASKLEKMLGNEKSQAKGRSKIAGLTGKKVGEVEEEEKERLALQRMIHGDVEAVKLDDKKNDAKKDTIQQNMAPESNVVRKLRIIRTFTAADGSTTTRVEIINNPQVIEGYDRIRKSRDNEFIRVYATMDEEYKEERRKEKRRLQDQLRRIKRKEQKDKVGAPLGRPKKKPTEMKPKPPPKPSLLKMKCSACGQNGHMKTNKNCPLYGQRLEQRREKEKTIGDVSKGSNASIAFENMSLPSGELMEIEGTKFKFSQKLLKHVESQKKKALKLRIPAEYINQQKMTAGADDSKGQLRLEIESDMDDSLFSSGFHNELASPASTAGSSVRMTGRSSFQRRRGTFEDTEYLIGPVKSIHRRRADPRVSMSTIFHEIFLELKALPGSNDLLHPVNARLVTDYYKIVKKPMDLQQIRTRITANKYELRSQFVTDLVLMLENSRLYNGLGHPITNAATQLVEIGLTRIKENEVRLIELEKMINPLLDEDDIVGFSYILADIVQQCKNLPKSAVFHTKVDPRKYPNYYQIIASPIDLGTIEQKVKDQAYQTTASFLADMEQIYKNSEMFNGVAEKSIHTMKAKEIYDLATKLVDEKQAELHELQSRIEAPAAAMDNQSVDYNTMDDEMTRDTFTHLDDQETQQDAEEQLSEAIMPTDDEATMDAWENPGTSGLVGSQMQMSGQLNADLELTDSDDSDTDIKSNKQSMAYNFDDL